jgi:hypothetical protein
MRPSRRAIPVKHRAVLPERSCLSLGTTVAALRRSREALLDIEGQLDDLLVGLRSPQPRVDGAAPQRLARAKAEATAAMANLGVLGSLFG